MYSLGNESWLNMNVLDMELCFTNYNFYRNHHNWTYGKSHVGDILITVNENIYWQLLNLDVFIRFEQHFLKLKFTNIKIVLDYVYKTSNATIKMYSNHCDTIESLFCTFPNHYFIIISDFNLNNFD
jgi:hypothetical protein